LQSGSQRPNQYRGVEQAVGHRLLAKRHPAIAALARQELSTTHTLAYSNDTSIPA
jgi:hypothetical protein